MSPSLALESAVFLFYTALAAGLLVFAGAVLAVLKWRRRKDVDRAWAAYGGWLLLVPILLLVFFLGREACIVLVTLVAVFGFQEFARASGLHEDRIMTATVDLGIGAVGVACLVPDPASGRPGWYDLFMALPVFVTAVILAIPVVRNRAQGQLRLVALAVLGFIYFVWMFGHLAFLANSAHAYNYLGYLVLAVAVTDVAAYTF